MLIDIYDYIIYLFLIFTDFKTPLSHYQILYEYNIRFVCKFEVKC